MSLRREPERRGELVRVSLCALDEGDERVRRDHLFGMIVRDLERGAALPELAVVGHRRVPLALAAERERLVLDHGQ
jgi:hypothetical protein